MIYGVDIAFSKIELKIIKKKKNMAKINERARKKLNFSTPKECFYKNFS